jgi:hypothetical protein
MIACIASHAMFVLTVVTQEILNTLQFEIILKCLEWKINQTVAQLAKEICKKKGIILTTITVNTI